MCVVGVGGVSCTLAIFSPHMCFDSAPATGSNIEWLSALLVPNPAKEGGGATDILGVSNHFSPNFARFIIKTFPQFSPSVRRSLSSVKSYRKLT